MEQLGLNEIWNASFAGKGANALSPLTLAYIGDAVFELMVRTMVVAEGNAPVNKLNQKARAIVNARAQAQMYFRIESLLTQEEIAVFKRGRNAKSHTVPKNADLTDYKHATGLEALFGYLYAKGEMERIMALYQSGLQK